MGWNKKTPHEESESKLKIGPRGIQGIPGKDGKDGVAVLPKMF